MEQACNPRPMEIEGEKMARKNHKRGRERGKEDVCNMDLQIVLSLKGVLCEPGCTAHTELAPVIF